MQKLLSPLHLSAILLLAGLLVTAGCSSMRFPGVYRIDVGQGNLITEEMLDKLRVGMTTRQVEYVMGSPMITDTFHPDRWDYFYSLETGKGIHVENQLTLYFEGERLARIDTNDYKDPDKLRDDLMQQMGLTPAPTIEPSAEAPEPEAGQDLDNDL